MDITISKAALQDDNVREILTTRPFQLSSDFSRYNDTYTIDCVAYEPENLETLRDALLNSSARGAKTAARDITNWLRAIDLNSTDLPKARKVEHAESLLRALLAKYPRHHVFEVQSVNDETAILCYYVERIRFVPKNDRHDYPAHVDIVLAYDLFGITKCRVVALFYQDILGKTAEQILACQGFLLETPELRYEYEKSVQKHRDLRDQIGLLVTAVGYADTDSVDSEDDKDWKLAGERLLGRSGTPDRLVVDVFKEKDRSHRSGSGHVVDHYFWSTEIKWVNDEPELADSNDAVDECIPEVPVHPYLVCFDLKRHMRLRVHVMNLTVYEYNKEIRKELSLPFAHSQLIDTLLSNRNRQFRDIIRNKSGGTIVLLQGKPGTGKTLTAEVYAESLGRPLYTVQCSQLGLEPEEMEKSLLKTLARARRWDAVMLIDEADVYVAARGDDLHRNAIVGVFLRVLEYEAGVLFLTTNRGDSVDDAILSRCTARLSYEKPSKESQRAIWRSLITANGIQVDHLETIVQQIVNDHDLSGRDIKNVLKLCIAIGADTNQPLSSELVTLAKQFKPTTD